MADEPPHPRQRHRFSREQRLRGKRAFDAVFDAKCRKHAGPLALRGKPNGVPYTRIGLVTSRRVGNAPRRNRIRRLLREAFRLTQHELPAGYDMVVVVRPHEPLRLTAYQQLLREGFGAIDHEWQRRRRRAERRKQQ